MRLKLYIPETAQVINISDITPTFHYGTSVVFTCHRRFESAISLADRVIFIDKKFKKYFWGDKIYLHFRHYETDEKIPKVSFKIRDLQYENLGQISNNFLEKQLKKVCNKRKKTKEIPHPPPKPVDKLPSWWPHLKREYMRIWTCMIVKKCWCKFFLNYHIYLSKHLNLFKQSLESFEENINKINSNAPT